MIDKHAKAGAAMPSSGGNTLGGSRTPAEARALRLAKLEAASNSKPAAAAETEDSKPAPMDTTEEVPPPSPAPPAPSAAPAADEKPKVDADISMEDADPVETKSNPVDSLDPYAIETLTKEMGFSLLKAQKGLLFSTGGTVASAIDWIGEHQDDVDIDEPIPEGAGQKAQSYKCNECGKILSNMANLELHANKTEKAAKIAEIKELLKSKRAEREECEKVDNVEREKQRRFMGKEMAKTREEMDKEQRKREAAARKREKQDQKRERERIRAELEKDKRERMANKGKLKSRLGADGYNPDAIQYDKDADGSGEPSPQKQKTGSTASAAKIDEYIGKVSSYRAGGDGGKCLKVLKLMIGNAADDPTNEKFKKINMESNAYKNKVKPFIGAKSLLLAVGFSQVENDPTHLGLKEDADLQVLKDTKAKLEKAMVAFG
ncbi:MAG: hypothetical protein SGARI_003324 [Bacillariaceae sp.]